MDKPNPGSNEAIKLGCTCPVLDNGHGKGAWDSKSFWISEDCPLHATNSEKIEEANDDNGS